MNLLLKFTANFVDTGGNLQAVSGVYRQCPEFISQCPEFAGRVRSLQAVSGVYRQCPEFTGSVRSLQAVSGLYRQCPEFTGSVWTLQAVSGNLPPVSFITAANFPSVSTKPLVPVEIYRRCH